MKYCKMVYLIYIYIYCCFPFFLTIAIAYHLGQILLVIFFWFPCDFTTTKVDLDVDGSFNFNQNNILWTSPYQLPQPFEPLWLKQLSLMGWGMGWLGPIQDWQPPHLSKTKGGLNTKVILSLGQLMKLAPNLSDYLTCHVLMPQDKETKGLECEFEKKWLFSMQLQLMLKCLWSQ